MSEYQIITTITKPRQNNRNNEVHTIHIFSGGLYSECVFDYIAYAFRGWNYPGKKMRRAGCFYKTIKVGGKQHAVVTTQALLLMIEFCRRGVPVEVLSELRLFDKDPEHKETPVDRQLLQATPFAKAVTPFYIDGTCVNIYYPELNMVVDITEKKTEEVERVKANLNCDYRILSQENIFEIVGAVTKLQLDRTQRDTTTNVVWV